jgi:hypothetical protein
LSLACKLKDVSRHARIALFATILITHRALWAAEEPPPPPHPFWDTTNACLFTGVAASRALDYTSTQHFRAKGLNEILLTNRIVDNKPLFAAIEIGGTALSMGASAWLHSHSHHKLERILSIVHIGVTTFGAIRNYHLQKH